jgi:hypothetical protein
VKVFLVLIAGLIVLGACGAEKTSPEYKATKTNAVPSYLRSYVVEADGLSYRCFDTGSYNGGLWCTQKLR